jgi:hypothetical protein
MNLRSKFMAVIVILASLMLTGVLLVHVPFRRRAQMCPPSSYFGRVNGLR